MYIVCNIPVSIYVTACISLAKHTLYLGCSSTQFRCNNGQCVSSSVRCNGVSEACSDGSDEIGCPSTTSKIVNIEWAITHSGRYCLALLMVPAEYAANEKVIQVTKLIQVLL